MLIFCVTFHFSRGATKCSGNYIKISTVAQSFEINISRKPNGCQNTDHGSGAQDARGEQTMEERLLVPFLACGDLSGYDADQSYDLPDENYQSLDPVQPPTAPAYRSALAFKKQSQGKLQPV